MNHVMMLGAIAAPLMAVGAMGAPIVDGFESYGVGGLPGGVWEDIGSRATANPGSSPSMSVVETLDAHGVSTNAIQSIGEVGTNGVFAEIESAEVHRFSVDIRIDALADPGEGWPMGVGFLNDVGQGDVNQNPHAVVYAWTNRTWRMYYRPGEDRPALDVLISGDRFELGSWYTISMEVDRTIGEFRISILDALSGEETNSRTVLASNWDGERSDFDALGFFDGESGGADSFGQATLDNVRYVPGPGGGVVMLMSGALLARRRR